MDKIQQIGFVFYDIIAAMSHILIMRNNKRRNLLHSCTVFHNLGTLLHGNQSIQYCAYDEISATALSCYATAYHDVVPTS